MLLMVPLDEIPLHNSYYCLILQKCSCQSIFKIMYDFHVYSHFCISLNTTVMPKSGMASDVLGGS